MIHTIEACIWVDIPEGGDPEDVASQMDRGLTRALSDFPAAEVVGAHVKVIRVTPQEEIDEEGLSE